MVNGILRQIMDYLIPPFNPPSIDSPMLFQWLMAYIVTLIGIATMFGIISWIINTIAGGIAIKYSSDMLESGQASLEKGLDFTLSKFFSLLAAGLITGLLTILGLILFVMPGVIIAIMFSLTVPVIVIEHQGVLESMGRSRRLVSKRWGETFIVLLIIFLLTLILNLMGEALGTSFGLLKTMFAIIIPALVQPLHPIAITFLYYSMRARERLIVPSMPLQQPAEPTITISPVAPSMQPRFCTRCGQELPPEAIFCPNCGIKIRRDYTF